MNTIFTDFKKWFEPYKSWFFKYKDGFFEFYPLTNSPEVIVESFKKIPFFKHDSQKQLFTTSTPFLEASMQYFTVEKGLFLLTAETYYKYNLRNTQSYSTFSKPKYFTIVLNIDYRYNQHKNEYHPNIYWIFYKPGTAIKTEYLKKSKGKYVSFYVTPEWLIQFLSTQNPDLLPVFDDFKQSSINQIIFNDTHNLNLKAIDDFFLSFNTLDISHVESQSIMKTESYLILNLFLIQLATTFKTKQYLHLSERDRIIVLNLEQYLIAALYKKFPGIEYLAEKVGCSETKIKTLFKHVHEESIFKYFQNLQMKRANELILYSNFKISEIAALFQYENVSKFITTYKQFTGSLPSDMRRNSTLVS